MQDAWTKIRDLMLNPDVRNVILLLFLGSMTGLFWLKRISYPYPGPAIAATMLALVVWIVGVAINNVRVENSKLSQQTDLLKCENEDLLQQTSNLRLEYNKLRQQISDLEAALSTLQKGTLKNLPRLNGLDILVRRWHTYDLNDDLIYDQLQNTLLLALECNINKIAFLKSFSGIKPKGGTFLVKQNDQVLRVLKFDSVKNIYEERKRFQDFIKDKTNYTAGEPLYSWPLASDLDPTSERQGVVLYKYAQMGSGNPKTFAEYYHSVDSEKKIQALKNMLEKLLDVMESWWKYENLPFNETGLYDEYSRIRRNLGDMRLGLEDQKVVKVIETYIPNAIAYQSELVFPSFSVKQLPNPLGWVSRVFANKTSFTRWMNDNTFDEASDLIERIRMSIVHGDFHASNILIEGDSDDPNIWLIDFPHTHTGPTVQDIARLEADIKFGLLNNNLPNNEPTFKALLAFEQAALGDGSRHNLDLSEKVLPQMEDVSQFVELELNKAWQSLAILRHPVRHQFLRTQDAKPYYLALLHATLPVLYYRDRTPWQKLYAFVSSALLCDLLDRQS